MERCEPCTRRIHIDCRGGNDDDWCECHCWSGELIDPARQRGQLYYEASRLLQQNPEQ